MSLLDWIEVGGEASHKDLIPAMKGSFSVAIGDVVNGIFGARHTHIYGGEIKLVCDPEDFLMGQLAHALPLTSALLAGIGGNATFVYAQNTSAVYGGPKIDIRRALSISKQSDYMLPRAGNPAHIADPPDAIDASMCAAVTVLSVLVNLVPAVLELVIRFKYPQYGSSSASSETLESYGETPGILKLCAFAITSRLMEFLKILEEKGTWADFAEFWSKVATYIGTKAEAGAAACVNILTRVRAWLADMAATIRNALTAAGNAIAEGVIGAIYF